MDVVYLKAKEVIVLGVVGLGVYLLYRTINGEAIGYVPTVGEYYPDNALAYSMASNNDAYQKAVNAFLTTPVNTTPSIKAGVDMINTAVKENVQLPRTSETIQKVSVNKNIARLSDGTIKVVSVNQPARDSAGMTNFDRIIAKNKATEKR